MEYHQATGTLSAHFRNMVRQWVLIVAVEFLNQVCFYVTVVVVVVVVLSLSLF